MGYRESSAATEAVLPLPPAPVDSTLFWLAARERATVRPSASNRAAGGTKDADAAAAPKVGVRAATSARHSGRTWRWQKAAMRSNAYTNRIGQ
jgi:hypothetical protein